jgi:hypothetical protein
LLNAAAALVARPLPRDRPTWRVSSTNPITDYHYMYALGAIVTAVTYAGHTWGLGRWWAQLPFVQRHRWLI